VPTDNIWQPTQGSSGGGLWHEGPKDPVGDGSLKSSGPTIAPNGVLTEATAFILARRINYARQHHENPWSSLVGGDDKRYGQRWQQLLQPGDTIRSLIPFNPNSRRPDVNKVGMGDPRTLALIGLTSSVQGKYFQPHPRYDSSLRHAQGLRTADNAAYFQGYSRDPDVEFNVKNDTDAKNARNVGTPQPPAADGIQEASRYVETHFGTMLLDNNGLPMKYQSSQVQSDLPIDVKQVLRSDGLKPDFDTGLAGAPDGGFCNKSAEGSNSWRTGTA